MDKKYIITCAIPGPCNATYVFDRWKDMITMEKVLKYRYPSLTFYKGETDEYGSKIEWDKPKFPK